MQSRNVIPLSILLASLLLLPGCMQFQRYEGDVEENPVSDMGVGAAVIMPGQSAPVMAPGGGYAPGGTTECRNGPGGQTCSQGGTVAPSPSNVTMIGGAEQDIENHVEAKEDPILLKWAAVPFALLAAPFVAAAEAAKGEPEPGPAIPKEKTERPEAEVKPVPQDYESQRIQQMDDELERQLAAQKREAPRAAPVQARVATPQQQPLPPSSAAGSASSGSFSIADELAALQRKPSAPEARPEAPPAPLESRTEAPAPRQASQEDDVADGIVDRDEDGRIDLWIYRENGEIVRKVLDQDFDGQPDTTLRYDPATHQLARVEEDDDHDGATDGWTDYEDGHVVRRRADASRDGLVDTWTFYKAGEITRHEQDTDGDGFRDRVGFYRDGNLMREEQDSNGDGVPDVTSHYDARERVIRREEDTNLDGRVDVINHYEKGRLARKELLGDPSTVVP